MPKERSDYDVELARAVLKTDRLPLLGICAGCQVLNIASGGSLIQDIPSHKPDSKVTHRGPQGAVRHTVTLVSGSKLAKIYEKTSFEVPTAHHQCVGKLGSQLKVAANTEDGIVESVENTERPFVVGVQWHPERDFENNEALFKEFVKQCSKYNLARKEQDI
jgi:Predicted glutamine amidotransferases